MAKGYDIQAGWLALLIIILVHLQQGECEEKKRKFEVDYTNDTFLKDGKPFKYAAGEMHYFRIPSAYWEDRLKKLRLMGLNAVQTYVEWSLHEESSGVFNFEGERNLTHFIRLAAKHGLLVLLRPGPYICAERDFGGHPSWLLTVNPNMKLRTSDPSYTLFVERWMERLFQEVKPLLYGNGGPIIMVQVENEYGSYPVNDKQYLVWLRDLFNVYVKDDAVLYTTDGYTKTAVTRGKIPDVFSTVDFGASISLDLDKSFAALRSIQSNGPLVNSEFYVGWITYWGTPWASVRTKPILHTLNAMLQKNVSFSMYMAHGGTNFGFSAGSDTIDKFVSDLTSYDYDAPITEAGDLTPKYFAIRDILKEHFDAGTDEEVQKLKSTTKGNYGNVKVSPVVTLLASPVGKAALKTKYPVSMEALGQRYGLIAYTTLINTPNRFPSVLQVTIRDRALVLLNNREFSTLAYTVINETPLPLTITPNKDYLTLLVENQGRRNFRLLSDCTKGMISNATIDGQTIVDWTVTGYPLNPDDIAKIETIFESKRVNSSDMDLNEIFQDTLAPTNNLDSTNNNVTIEEAKANKMGVEITQPLFLTGEFTLEKDEIPKDTFLDMSLWGKGVAFVNQFNLGRYWNMGPQVTLYVPATILRPYPEPNKITLMELYEVHPNRTVSFVTDPIVKEVQVPRREKHLWNTLVPSVAKIDR